MKHLSIAAISVEGQPMFKMLDKVQKLERTGREILHFELGEPNFDTPPNIVEAACHALKNGETHYTSSMGLYAFRKVVQQTTQISRGFKPDIEQILVTPGANAIICLAVSCLVNPGEELLPNIGEVNEEKFGAYTPGTLIPIVPDADVHPRPAVAFQVLFRIPTGAAQPLARAPAPEIRDRASLTGTSCACTFC